jgi:hypothetical protein
MAPIVVNRAPVLTLWAAVVAERLGYTRDEALTLGRAVAGLNARSKARALGIAPERAARKSAKQSPAKPAAPPSKVIELMGRRVPVARTKEGLRALGGKNPVHPDSVERYLEDKFGESLPAVRKAMLELARAVPKSALDAEAFGLYESFRPSVARGVRGWGASGVLDLNKIRSLAKPER